MTTSTTFETVDGMVAKVEPVLRKYAAQAEAERRLAPEAIAALHDAGVFRSLLPKAYGGLEMDPLSALRLFEAIAHIDSAAGWISANQSGVSTLPMLFSAACGDELFAQPRTLLAGGWFPPGRAEPVQDGYRVSGQWAFGSGSNYAGWFTGQALVFENDVPKLGPDGNPLPLIVWVRASETQVLDNWNTLGMRGTGSHDVQVESIFVPEHRVWPIGPYAPVNRAFRDGLSRMGLWWFSPLVAGVSLGIARAAITDLIQLAQTKTPSYTQVGLADKPVVQDQLARARAGVDAARAYLYGALAAADEAVQTQPTLTIEQGIPLALAASHAVEAAGQAVDLVHHSAGTSGIRNELRFQQYFRDVHTISQHAFVSPARFESVGKLLLGRESDWPFYAL